MMYSAGMVQSASSSNSQYPAALCVPIMASLACVMLRSRSVETVLVSERDTTSARTGASVSALTGFCAMRIMSRSPRKSGGAAARAPRGGISPRRGGFSRGARPPRGGGGLGLPGGEFLAGERLVLGARVRPGGIGAAYFRKLRKRKTAGGRGEQPPQHPIVAYRKVSQYSRHGHRPARDLDLRAGRKAGTFMNFLQCKHREPHGP